MNRMALAFFMLLAACANAAGQPSESKKDIADSAVRYTSARDESQRLAASIEAIDKRLICKGCGIETVNAIFGTSFSTKDLSVQGDNGLFAVVIPLRPSAIKLREKGHPFVSPEDSEKNPPSATAISGWRLGITYDNYGKIRMYYLSNAGQDPIGF